MMVHFDFGINYFFGKYYSSYLIINLIYLIKLEYKILVFLKKTLLKSFDDNNYKIK